MSNTGRNLWHRRDRSRRIAAYGVAALGLIGLLSAASRPLRGRLEDLLQVVPFLVPRTAALTLVFVSFALFLTARGLRRGHRLAWLAALTLLLVSVVLHLAKGIDVEEAVLATTGAVWLVVHREAFPVRPSRAAATRALVVGVGGGVVTLTVATGLATLGRRHHPYPGESARAAAARLGSHGFFPLSFGSHFTASTLVAVGLGVLGSTLWVLLSPRSPLPLTGAAHHAERERAREVVRQHGGGTLDYFALRDDKQWFFIGNSVVAYAVRAGVCLVSPDPIGPRDEREETWAEFMAHAENSGWSVSVLGAAQEWLPHYEHSGLHPVYLGDEAVVDCSTFSLEGRPMRGLRQAVHRLTRAGFTAAFHDPATVDDELREQLQELSRMSRRGHAERGFSMTLSRLFDPEDTGLLLSVARDRAGRPVAFVHWVPARDLQGWSLDVMRRSTREGLPNGIIDLLLVETIRHVAAAGGGGLGLNFAVMRSVVAGEHAGPLARVGRGVLSRLSGRAQVESLWRFNAKYRPRWVPRYVVLGSVDALAGQGLVMAGVEGFGHLPVLRRPTDLRRPRAASPSRAWWTTHPAPRG